MVKKMMRNANQEDLEQLVEINNESAEWVGVKDKEFFEKCISHVSVVEEEKILGFALIMNQSTDYNSPHFLQFKQTLPKFFYVDRIVVRQEARGKGIGRELYSILREIGAIAPIVCEICIEPLNADLVAFHERIGFKKIGQDAQEGKMYGMYSYKDIKNAGEGI